MKAHGDQGMNMLRNTKKYPETPKIHLPYYLSLTDLPKIQHGSFNRNRGSVWKKLLKQMPEENSNLPLHYRN